MWFWITFPNHQPRDASQGGAGNLKSGVRGLWRVLVSNNRVVDEWLRRRAAMYAQPPVVVPPAGQDVPLGLVPPQLPKRSIWRKLWAFICGAGMVVVMIAAAPADAQAPCGPAKDIAAQLRQKYGEYVISLGLQANGNLLQVYGSEKGATWTIVTTNPKGLSCVLASGRRWLVGDPA